MLHLPDQNQHFESVFSKHHSSNHSHHMHVTVDMSKDSLLKNLNTLRGSVKSGKESVSALSGSVLGLRGSSAYESLNADSVLASKLLAKFLKHVDKVVKIVKDSDQKGEATRVETGGIQFVGVYYARRKLYNEFI